MADSKIVLDSLIEKNGGRLVRQKRHKVYRFPNGTTFVVSNTPECPFAYDNALAQLRRLLGVNPPERGAPGARRNKRLKRKNRSNGVSLPTADTQRVDGWKEKLKIVAVKVVPPPPKPRREDYHRKPFTFEERMLNAGVRRISCD